MGRGRVAVLTTLVAAVSMAGPAGAIDEPPSTIAQAEARVTVTGVVRTVMDVPDDGVQRWLHVDEGLALLLAGDTVVPDGPVTAVVATPVSLARAAAERIPVRLLSATATPAKSRSTVLGPTAHRAYVAVISNSDHLSESAVRAYTQKEADWWQAESEGLISSFRVASVTTYHSEVFAEVACQNWEFNPFMDEADDLFPGVDFSDSSDHLTIVLPDQCGGGRADLGAQDMGFANGGRSIVAAGEGDAQAKAAEFSRVLRHEWGHNFSLWHSGSVTCATYHEECDVVAEYFDLYTPMGTGKSGVLTYVERRRLGLSDETRQVSLSSTQASASFEVLVQPRTGEGGVRAVEIIDPDTGSGLWLEYRSGTGRDSDAYYATYTKPLSDQPHSLEPGLVITTETAGAPYETGDVSGVDQYVVGGRGTWIRSGGFEQDWRWLSWTIGQEFSTTSGSVRIRVDSAAPSSGLHATVTLTGGPALPSPPSADVIEPPYDWAPARIDLGPWPEGTEHTLTWLLDTAPIGDDITLTGEHEFVGQAPVYFGSPARIGLRIVSQAPGYRPVRQELDLGLPRPSRPVIRGSARVGKQVWIEDEPATGTLSWRVNGTTVGADAELTLTPEMVDGELVLRNDYLAADGQDAWVDSLSLNVEPGRMSKGSVRVRGGRTPRVGDLLVARPRQWPEGATFAFQWLVGRTPLPGATGKSLLLDYQQLGRRLKVRVTASVPGYVDATRTSQRTGKIQPGS